MSKSKPSKNVSGKKIREFRIKADLRQEDIVAALAVDFDITLDRSALGRIERGDRGVYDYELKAIAEVLGCKVSDLIKE